MTRHWCYILECEDSRIYIGETTRLYTRFYQHGNTERTKNTTLFPPVALIGLYDISKNIAYINYKNNKITKEEVIDYFDNNIHWNDQNTDMNHLDIENLITENTMIIQEENWWKVRGGKYTRPICDLNDDDYESANTESIICNSNNFLQLQNINNPVQNQRINRPKCKCNLPCEIHLSKKNVFYFKCPLWNTDWIFEPLLQNNIDLESDCDFFKWG